MFHEVTILSILYTIVTMTVLRSFGALFETTERRCWISCCGSIKDITGAAAYGLFIFLICVNIPIDFAAAGVTRGHLARLKQSEPRFTNGLRLLLLDILIKTIFAFIGLFISLFVGVIFAKQSCVEQHSLGFCIGIALFTIIELLPLSGMEWLVPAWATTFPALFLAMLLCSLWIWMYFFFPPFCS